VRLINVAAAPHGDNDKRAVTAAQPRESGASKSAPRDFDNVIRDAQLDIAFRSKLESDAVASLYFGDVRMRFFVTKLTS